MNKIYKIKPFTKDPEMLELDRIRREKVEKVSGKLTDEQWRQYKKLAINRPKY
jgi:hypothetical protein